MSSVLVGCAFPFSSMARLMIVASPPVQFHRWRKRVCAFDSTGSCNLAAVHVAPPSVLTSTRWIFPDPDHAMPLTSTQPRLTVTGYAGYVMSERGSMRKLKMRAVPSAIGSVYFDVSSRVMNGRSDSSMRRSHLTLELPSHPGRNSRAG